MYDRRWQQRSEVWDFFKKDGPKKVRCKVCSSQGTVLAYLDEPHRSHNKEFAHANIRISIHKLNQIFE